MYQRYVRPILEYASQIWSPIQKCNIDKVERVQRYFTRRLLYSENLSYSERLAICNLDPLEERRIKADIVLFYKMINNDTIINIQESYLFHDRNRGHNRNLFMYFCRTEKRKLFWINRIVTTWNNLSSNIVNSISANSFKRKICTMHFLGRGSFYC